MSAPFRSAGPARARAPLRSAAVTLLTLAALAGVVAAAEGVTATAAVDRTTITLGDPVQLTVVVEAAPGYQVDDPILPATLGALEVLETQAAQLLALPSGATRLAFRYRVTAFALGEHEIPSIDVPYAGPAGQRGVARTAPLAIAVESVVRPVDDTSDIKPLKPQLVLPGTQPLAARAAMAGAAVVAVAIPALVVFRLMRRRERAALAETRAAPGQRALEELQRLAELRLPEQGRAAEHYELMAACVRRYALERFGLSPGRTARELRGELVRAGVDRDTVALIFDVLREGEVVRYRKHVPYPAHARNALRACLEVMAKAAKAEEYEVTLGRPH